MTYEVHYTGWHLAWHMLGVFAPLLLGAGAVCLVFWWRGGRLARAAALVITLVLALPSIWNAAYMVRNGDARLLLLVVGTEAPLAVAWLILLVVAFWSGQRLYNRRRQKVDVGTFD